MSFWSRTSCYAWTVLGEADEGIKEVIRDLDVALFHLFRHLFIFNGTQIFFHIAQVLLTSADAFAQSLDLVFILTDDPLLALDALLQLCKIWSFRSQGLHLLMSFGTNLF